MKGFASLCGIKGNRKLANLTNYPNYPQNWMAYIGQVYIAVFNCKVKKSGIYCFVSLLDGETNQVYFVVFKGYWKIQVFIDVFERGTV